MARKAAFALGQITTRAGIITEQSQAWNTGTGITPLGLIAHSKTSEQKQYPYKHQGKKPITK